VTRSFGRCVTAHGDLIPEPPAGARSSLNQLSRNQLSRAGGLVHQEDECESLA